MAGYKPWVAVPLLDKIRLAKDTNPQTNLRLMDQKGELVCSQLVLPHKSMTKVNKIDNYTK